MMRHAASAALIIGLATLLQLNVSASGVDRKQCFPIETLSMEEQTEARELLGKMLESEALLTLVGDLKPMSSGWLQFRIEVDKPDQTKLERYQRIVSTLRCGDEIQTVLAPFTRVFEGKRFIEAFVFNKSSYAAKVSQYPQEFGFLGISPSMPIGNVNSLIDGEPSPERSRAYGLLFGYPKHAVDFFVSAEASQRKDGAFVKREFYTVPIFDGKTHRFVYAVPEGYKPGPEEEAIKNHITMVVSAYTARRPKYMKEGKLDALNLIRDWYADRKGRCSPKNAKF